MVRIFVVLIGRRTLCIVNVLTEKTITVDLSSTATIADLKTFIQDTEGIPPDEQRLTIAGKMLKDDHTIADYNLHLDASVNMILDTFEGVFLLTYVRM